MHVGVLGGGMQGCCIAIALAARGVRVTLFDRNDALMTRAAIINEGKIHLGYMYGGDRSLATARTMIAGAFAFAPFLARHLAIAPDRMQLSVPATYVVHRRSLLGPEDSAAYLAAVHDLIGERAAGREDAYFGIDLQAPEAQPESIWDGLFDPAQCLAAFKTSEVAINPVAVAAEVAARISGDPAIEVRLKHSVQSVFEDGKSLVVHSTAPAGKASDRFDHVVNALWDGRLAVDECLGHRPHRPWLHRFKFGVQLRASAHHPRLSTTIILGPFGEVVNYGDGTLFLTWYPSCLFDRSSDVTPPDWPMYPGDPLRSKIVGGTVEGLAEVVPFLRATDPADVSNATVGGGVIVAWGETDIDDPESELHQRFAIGVTTSGRYHSVDPGKLTMIPYFAELCAERISPAGV